MNYPITKVKTSPTLTCGICFEPLITNTSVGKPVTTFCGHVFHSTCIDGWYNTLGSNKASCATCRDAYLGKYTMDLYMREEEDDEYNRLYNAFLDQKKDLNVAEIRLILFSSNKTKLENEFSNLEWDSLNSTFQEELKEKLKLGFPMINVGNMDLSFLKHGCLIEIIGCTSVELSLLYTFLYEYYYAQLTTLGFISLNNFKQIFKFDLLERLRYKCTIPSLSLKQIPVSHTVLLKILENNEHVMNMQDSQFLIKLVRVYLEKMSRNEMNELCRIILISMIKKQFNNSHIELFINHFDEKAKNDLVSYGTLKSEGGDYKVIHDCVKMYILGLLCYLVRQNIKLTKKNCLNIFFDGYLYLHSLEQYFFFHFNDAIDSGCTSRSEHVDKCTESLKFAMQENIDLIVILAVMKLKNTREFVHVFRNFDIFCSGVRKSILEFGYVCKIGCSIVFFKLPHFVSTRGNKDLMRTLYFYFVVAGNEHLFDIRDLVRAYASETELLGEEERTIRKQLISFIISLDEIVLKNYETYETPRDVHINLLEFIIEKDIMYFQSLWNLESMILEIANDIGDQFVMKLMYCLSRRQNYMEIIKIYCEARGTFV